MTKMIRALFAAMVAGSISLAAMAPASAAPRHDRGYIQLNPGGNGMDRASQTYDGGGGR